jgi:phage terminase small subunit
MPALSNQKQERFAQLIAQGRTATEAYVEAGYVANDGNAARMKGNDRVSARVSEIQTAAARRAEITVEGLTRELLDILVKAKAEDSAGHLNAARQSVMDIAKLNGLVIDKAESTAAGSLTVTYVNAPASPAPAPGPEDYETAE